MRVPLTRSSTSSSSSGSSTTSTQRQTVYHGTRSGSLCLTARDGLRSSGRSLNITGLWFTDKVKFGLKWGRTPLDVFLGCVIEAQVAQLRRNSNIGRNRAVLETQFAGEPTDADLKAVHLQIPSQEWFEFVSGLKSAITDVAED